ncbi:hypothetical protein ACGFNP_23825 [Nonomuraea sp. NPDC049269]|uniref:hypothetical protein n=1 Tax=Nonomuraea sp. NPDC049269 TaxID=3364349 RepID=UPI00371613B4
MDYLGRTRGVVTTSDQIVITSGYYQGLSLLSGVLAATGIHTVAIEDPGHNLFRDVVRCAGPTVLPLPVDHRGARANDSGGILRFLAISAPTTQGDRVTWSGSAALW